MLVLAEMLGEKNIRQVNSTVLVCSSKKKAVTK